MDVIVLSAIFFKVPCVVAFFGRSRAKLEKVSRFSMDVSKINWIHLDTDNRVMLVEILARTSLSRNPLSSKQTLSNVRFQKRPLLGL